jgi:hypothetical protein
MNAPVRRGCVGVCSRVTCVSRRPSEEVHGLCLGPFSPRPRVSLARPARAASWAFWRGRPAGKRAGVLVCAVAADTSGVTASVHGSKLSVDLTPLGAVSNHAWWHSS